MHRPRTGSRVGGGRSVTMSSTTKLGNRSRAGLNLKQAAEMQLNCPTNCVQHKFYQQRQHSRLFHQEGGKTSLYESHQQVGPSSFNESVFLFNFNLILRKTAVYDGH